MTNKQKLIDFIQYNYMHMSCSEIAKEFNRSTQSVYYWIMELGLTEKIKKFAGAPGTANPRNDIEFFDVDAVGNDGTWLI